LCVWQKKKKKKKKKKEKKIEWEQAQEEEQMSCTWAAFGKPALEEGRYLGSQKKGWGS
jgi:hypothetical protein